MVDIPGKPKDMGSYPMSILNVPVLCLKLKVVYVILAVRAKDLYKHEELMIVELQPEPSLTLLRISTLM